MKNDESTQPFVVSDHPNCACIGIAATEMFVRSMYEISTAAPHRNTTPYHTGHRRATATSAAAADGSSGATLIGVAPATLGGSLQMTARRDRAPVSALYE